MRFTPSSSTKRTRRAAINGERHIRFGLLCFMLTTLGAAPSHAEFDAQAQYTKSEHDVVMRDGIRLHTVIYRPKVQQGKRPILLSRTPYSVQPYGEAFIETIALAPSEEFLRAGYILVFQDVRGAHLSQGEFVYLKPIRANRKDARAVDESTDTYDTIDWLVRNVPRNNGRVGLWGISYDGWQSAMGLVDSHPALKAVSPQATTADAFIGDDNHFNGVFYLAGSLAWAYPMSLTTDPERSKHIGSWPESDVLDKPWGYDFFIQAGPAAAINQRFFGGRLTSVWEDLIAHPDYDEYWQRRNVAQYMTHIKAAVLNVAGWYDHADPYGTFATYRAIEERNPGNRSTIVAGPWRHGGWLWDDGSQFGPNHFGRKTSDDFKKDIVFPFFRSHLEGEGDWQPAEAIVYETGGNAWHRFDQWPPRNVASRSLYLHQGGKLAFARPQGAGTHDTYVSDPAKPVPYSHGVPMAGGFDPLVEDQRLWTTRPDVLVYATEPLDADLTLAGAALVRLFGSTSGTDCDWFVRLIDVYPADAEEPKLRGYQMKVAIQALRSKYRNSYSHPEPMTPDAVTPISLQMPDRMHTFKKGHRLMVQVHSSWFPEFDRNPQVFTNIYTAPADAYRKATQKVYRSGEVASHIELPVLP